MSHFKFTNKNEAEIYNLLSREGIAPPMLIDDLGYTMLITSKRLWDRHNGHIGENMKQILLEKVQKMHDLGIFHGDLHERNVVLSENEPFIIDFGNSEFIKDMIIDENDKGWYKPKEKTIQSYLDFEKEIVEKFFN